MEAAISSWVRVCVFVCLFIYYYTALSSTEPMEAAIFSWVRICVFIVFLLYDFIKHCAYGGSDFFMGACVCVFFGVSLNGCVLRGCVYFISLLSFGDLIKCMCI